MFVGQCRLLTKRQSVQGGFQFLFNRSFAGNYSWLDRVPRTHPKENLLGTVGAGLLEAGCFSCRSTSRMSKQ